MVDSPVCVEIIDEPIEWDRYQHCLANPDVGAHAWFYGVTRRTTDGRVTELLHYEAHREMALRQMHRIADESIKRFGLEAVVMVHRLGDVPIGQASVLVGCCSAHRPESFAALPWMMEQLKKDVPIWKKEYGSHGTQDWVHPVDSGDQ